MPTVLSLMCMMGRVLLSSAYCSLLSLMCMMGRVLLSSAYCIISDVYDGEGFIKQCILRDVGTKLKRFKCRPAGIVIS